MSTTSVEHVPASPPATLWLLVAAQALGGAAAPVIISLGGLVGQWLSSSPAMATLPVSLFNLGLALSTIPAAWLIRRRGRRRAYLLGGLTAIVAGLIAAMGILQQSFVIFCIGTALAGFYNAFVHSYRFAAADLVPPAEQPKAISKIMIGGLFAAMIGPQVVILTRNIWIGAPFAASFLAQAGLAVLALPILWSLRLPPPRVHVSGGTGRPLSIIARQPAFIVAVSAAVVSYGLMAFIMTAAPMAMIGSGFNISDATLGIQWHVLAMFAPSFFTGHLIHRLGAILVTAVGMLLIASSALLAMAGLELIHFWGSLILLGVGWNFGFIGATSLLTRVYEQGEQAKVQALNDFLMFGTVAVASFGAGQLLHQVGWARINALALPAIGVVLVMLVGLALLQRRTSPV